MSVIAFKDSPAPLPPGVLQPGFENKVMHSSFRVGGSTVMASDGCNDQSKFDGFGLSLSVATEAEANRTHDDKIRFQALVATGAESVQGFQKADAVDKQALAATDKSRATLSAAQRELDVIGTRKFMELVEQLEKDEDLKLEKFELGKDHLVIQTIAPDPAKAEEKDYKEAETLIRHGLEQRPDHRQLQALQKDVAEKQKPKRQTFGSF